MPTLQQEKLNKLTEILKMMDENISKQDFVASFENVIKLVLKVQKELADKHFKNIEDLKSLFSEFRNNLEEKTNAELLGAINKLEEMAMKTFKEQQTAMNLIRDKVGKIKEGKDGKDGKPGKDGLSGKDGSPDVATQIRDKLEGLKGKERLDKSAIDGLEEELKKIQVGPGMTIFGGNRPLQIQEAGTVKDKAAKYLNFTGATITRAIDGVVTIAVAGGTPVSEEVPVDSGDHINFTIAHTPATGTFKLYRGGSRQKSGGVDYTLTGIALVLVVALATGETLICDYNY